MSNVKIVNGATGKVLDVPGADSTNGVRIQQWDDLGNAQQQWQIVNVGGGMVKIVNGATGKVLDVPNANTVNGVQIQQWDDLGNAQQQWQIVDVGRGMIKIVNGATGKVLDVPGADSTNGVRIQQWDDLGNAQQQWRTVQAAVALTNVSTDTGDETLKEEGTNQYTAFHMQTVATLDIRLGLLSGTTRSTSDYDLKGFTGGSQVYVLDANNTIIYLSQIQQVGVDGKWVLFKESSRTVPWNEQIDPSRIANASSLKAINFFDPHNRLLPILQSLPSIIMEAGKTWDDVKYALCHAFPSLGIC